MATTAQMVTIILKKLHVLEAGETADPEDSETVTAALARAHEELRELEVCHWSDNAVPAHIEDALALYVAGQIAEEFRGAQGAIAYKQEGVAALRRIRALTESRERTDKPTRAEYY